jgi:RNA polymerase sigma-54 factor
MLKPALHLKLGQQLTMTPQLQQAIRLLQLPVLELQAQVQEALESNVMLEAEEEEQIDLASLDQPAPQAEDDDGERDQADEIVVEMEDPWAESSTPSGDGRAQDDDDRPLEFTDERERDLHQHLIWQLEVSRLDPRQVWIGEAIVDALNEDGYLTETVADIARSLSADLPVSEEDVEQVLAFVQTLDPTGVGARTASECICLQIAQLDPDTPGRELALAIAHDHLPAVAERDLASLRRSFDVDDDALLAAQALIRACNPRPGSAFEGSQPEYIVPDVFVRRTDQGWSVEINPASVPRLKVNQGYASLVSRSADYATLRAQLQEARWLIRSLEIRNDTLLKVRAPSCNGRRPFSSRRRGDATDDPARRRRGGRHARIHDLARHHQQVHAHAARHLRVPLLLLEPRVGGRRRGRVLGGDPGTHPQADRGRSARQAPERRAARRSAVARGREGGAAHRGEVSRGTRPGLVERAAPGSGARPRLNRGTRPRATSRIEIDHQRVRRSRRCV